MTQTASISSIDKRKFLRKTLKGFGISGTGSRSNPPMPAPGGRMEEHPDRKELRG
ncbi:hypothetical protein [Maridesulfovibrio sp.]|uniref:hypothetical protein n=1 Tax=Maridesulfovibrio sp. TaxID=2795000 RepID=UPI002A189655|nr:hypothetical protein [Maridesulfovibrio sp.]